MKRLLCTLTASLTVASCVPGGDSNNPPSFRAFGLPGSNSAIATPDSCSESGDSPRGFSDAPFFKEGFAVGYSHSVRIATQDPEAPTLRSSSQETILVTPGSRVELPLDPQYDQYDYGSLPGVHTWEFQVEALAEGDAELIVERHGEDIDSFAFKARQVDRWDVDDNSITFLTTVSGDTDKRVLGAYDESGNELAHEVRAHWSTQSVDVAGFTYFSAGDNAVLASRETGCARLASGHNAGPGRTTISVTSPVGAWSIDVTVE